MSHSERTSSHESPRSCERNSPPGMVPHHSSSGRSTGPFSSVHSSCTVHGHGSCVIGETSVASAGRGGYAGAATSAHAPPGVAAPDVRTEVAGAERGVDGAVVAHHGGGDRLAEELDVGDRPSAGTSIEREQSLPGSDQQRHRHPPDRACITVISVSGSTGSDWWAGSRNLLATDEHHHVAADARLIVEHVRAHLRVQGRSRRRGTPRRCGPPPAATGSRRGGAGSR